METTQTEPTDLALAIAAGNALKERGGALADELAMARYHLEEYVAEFEVRNARDAHLAAAFEHIEHRKALSDAPPEVRHAVNTLINQVTARQDGAADRQGSRNGNTEQRTQ